MSEKKIYIYQSYENSNELVGYLYSYVKGQGETCSFQYADSWLENKNSFSLDPLLPLGTGTHYSQKPLFGAIGDSAPDRWGETLMRRFEQTRAKEEKRTARSLHKIDYLLLVNDDARQGSLRFKEHSSDEFLFPPKTNPIPPLIALPELLRAAQKIDTHTESANDLRLLLEPGSSLGGARPKASVIDGNGNLSIAKFPKKDDSQNIVTWEAVALRLAEMAGLRVPEWQLLHIKKKPVLVIKRFDRNGTSRLPFVSAMSMLGANDGDNNYSYMEIADVLRQFGSKTKLDMEELWRRIVFSIMISNTDDHLRNHGFLRLDSKGWRLSPVYDINPNSEHTGFLHTMISETDSSATIENALSVSDYFEIKLTRANEIILEVTKAVAQWKRIAKEFSLSANEIASMERAFLNVG